MKTEAEQMVQHVRSRTQALVGRAGKMCASVFIRGAHRLCVLPVDSITSALTAPSCKANRAVILSKRSTLTG